MMYRECPYCGLNLDPGEICDCRREKENECAAPATMLHTRQEKERHHSIALPLSFIIPIACGECKG